MMAEIKPLRALRFCASAGPLSELVCPPYSSIREEQRRMLLEKNPHNIVRLELGERPYTKAKETLLEWENSGVLKQDTTPSIFLYEDEFLIHGQVKKRKGILCLVKIEDYEKSVILPREDTLSKNRIDRFELLKATSCQFSPIHCVYQDKEREIMNRMETLSGFKPRFTFSEGEITRRLWLVNDPVAIRAFCEDFAGKQFLIAEGHHRYEAALQLRNWYREEGIGKEGDEADYILTALTDMESDGLTLLPTYRLVRGLPNFNEKKMLEDCRPYFDVIARDSISEIETNLDALYRQGKTAFGCYCSGESWNLLILKDSSVMQTLLPEKSEALQNTDAAVLHSLILERLLGINSENAAQQINLTYTEQFETGISTVREGSNQCAFFINPPRIKEVREIAAAGERMIQESARFYPQPVAGLVMNQIHLE